MTREVSRRKSQAAEDKGAVRPDLVKLPETIVRVEQRVIYANPHPRKDR